MPSIFKTKMSRFFKINVQRIFHQKLVISFQRLNLNLRGYLGIFLVFAIPPLPPKFS